MRHYAPAVTPVCNCPREAYVAHERIPEVNHLPGCRELAVRRAISVIQAYGPTAADLYALAAELTEAAKQREGK